MSLSFDYSNTASSNKDRVRLLIADTIEDTHIFEDEEIDALLTMNSNELMATAAAACRIIAVDRAKQAIAYKLLTDSVEIDKTAVPKYFIKLADKYDAMGENYCIEYIDSIQYGVDKFGSDHTEYINDDEL